MTQTKATCGKKEVTYDDRCSWMCMCLPKKGCGWAVSCPDGRGGWYTTVGTGRAGDDPDDDAHGRLTIRGPVEACAAALQTQWGRPVKVPGRMKGQVLDQTVTS